MDKTKDLGNIPTNVGADDGITKTSAPNLVPDMDRKLDHVACLMGYLLAFKHSGFQHAEMPRVILYMEAEILELVDTMEEAVSKFFKVALIQSGILEPPRSEHGSYPLGSDLIDTPQPAGSMSTGSTPEEPIVDPGNADDLPGDEEQLENNDDNDDAWSTTALADDLDSCDHFSCPDAECPHNSYI